MIYFAKGHVFQENVYMGKEFQVTKVTVARICRSKFTF